MARRYLGMDGVGSDETAARYYEDDGKIIENQWGSDYIITKEKALRKLRHAREMETAHYLVPDPLAPDRVRAIDKVIAAIEALPEEGQINLFPKGGDHSPAP